MNKEQMPIEERQAQILASTLLGSEWMGWRNIASCERNPFWNKILNHCRSHFKSSKDLRVSTGIAGNIIIVTTIKLYVIIK